MAYIYKIVNKINGKIYIGSTRRENAKHRWYNHTTELRRNKHHNRVLQYAWNKYGEENFEFVVLEEVSEDMQFIVENKYLEELKPFPPNGYNLARKAQDQLHAKYARGEAHPNSILNIEDVEKIKILMSQGYTNKEIEKKFNASPSSISSIKKLLTWSHVRADLNQKIKENTNTIDEQKRINNKNYLLFYDQIINLYNNKVHPNEISNKLNISIHIVQKVIYREKNKDKLSHCINCGQEIFKKSNNHKYCKKCKVIIKNKRTRNRIKKHKIS